ncbi:MAG TPA: transporter substrate-binding domain-containing protein [Actinomycetota bacterium]|jgi:polar amino acid transport system substrate-binding protein|nr:transporter substrate-binding domain-containing protein [Actinomycetota bacterium]
MNTNRVTRPPRLRPGVLVAVALLAALAAGCGIPKDPESTLDRVRGGTLRAGITASEPWTTLEGGRPGGVEVALVERFAEELGARVEWVDGSEADLIGALELRELDLVVGGLTADTPWQTKAAITRSYATTRVVVAVPASQPPPDDIAGLRVAVESGTDAAGILEDKTDAIAVRVPDVTQVSGSAVAIDEWLLADLDLRDTGVHLSKAKHVMATPMGENAFLVRLERFLIAHQDEVPALLDAAASR